MPGTGHSSRYKGSISNRNSKPAFQVLAPWNSNKNGNFNQVPVSGGGDSVNFKLMNAKMMSNYDKNTDEFTFDCSVNVTGSTIHTGDVQYQGDVTVDGVLSAQTALIQDLSAINITDVSDNVLTLGNHESFSTQHMRGIFMSHLGTGFTDEFSFMGFDPCGNDCAGIVNDSHGQFVFLTDASFNSQAPADECNITGEAGRVLVGTLDISGSSRYGNGGPGSGLPTQNVTGQANSSMHLVGKTIIAQDGSNSAQLDISGGVNVVGPSILTDSGNEISLNTNASTNGGIGLISDNLTTADPTTQRILIQNKKGNQNASILIKSELGGIDINAVTDIALGAGQKIDIGANASEINIGGGGGTVDICGAQVKIENDNGDYIDINTNNIELSGNLIVPGKNIIATFSDSTNFLNLATPPGVTPTQNTIGMCGIIDISAGTFAPGENKSFIMINPNIKKKERPDTTKQVSTIVQLTLYGSGDQSLQDGSVVPGVGRLTAFVEYDNANFTLNDNKVLITIYNTASTDSRDFSNPGVLGAQLSLQWALFNNPSS